MSQTQNPGNLWSIILAGGEGERLRPMVQNWLGTHQPKQYCTFVGTRSMLEHTLDRADRLSSPQHKVTVTAQTHHREAREHFDRGRGGKVVLQPANRDTAAGIFLALSTVRSHDADATVVIYPSDHFVYPEDRFVERVRRAVLVAQSFPDRLVLLGVAPDGPEPEYGWIQPGDELACSDGHSVRAVRAFLEKPSSEKAQALMSAGGLWNTLVLAARLETLWDMGWSCFPGIMMLFERLGKAVGTSREKGALESIYQIMPRRNFSSDLLQRVTDRVAVVQMRDVLWSDWGKEERIVKTLRRIGKHPAFQSVYAAAV